jgi:hypothetical protein
MVAGKDELDLVIAAEIEGIAVLDGGNLVLLEPGQIFEVKLQPDVVAVIVKEIIPLVRILYRQ